MDGAQRLVGVFVLAAACGGGAAGAGDDVGTGGSMPTAPTMTANDDGDGGSSAGGDDADDTSAPTACTIFPADNPWNTDISGYPVHPIRRGQRPGTVSNPARRSDRRWAGCRR